MSQTVFETENKSNKHYNLAFQSNLWCTADPENLYL